MDIRLFVDCFWQKTIQESEKNEYHHLLVFPQNYFVKFYFRETNLSANGLQGSKFWLNFLFVYSGRTFVILIKKNCKAINKLQEPQGMEWQSNCETERTNKQLVATVAMFSQVLGS